MKMKVFYLILFLAFSASAQVITGSTPMFRNIPALSADEEADSDWNLAWHGRMATLGDPDSQFFVAQVFDQGRLVPRNLSRAIEFYEKAAAQGHAESCMRLYHVLEDTDPARALHWLITGGNSGDAQAQLRLAQYYAEHNDLPRQAFWLEKALRQMFPTTADLTTVSPELKQLKERL